MMKTLIPITFLILLLTITVSISACKQSKEESTEVSGKPNIIIIIPDDLGWHDVGYNGSSIETPNIDQLARTGIILNQHYVMPTCTPTRVSLMTGKYPSRYGITGPDYGEVIDLGDPTIASLMSENGYQTSIAGKWHMGSPPFTPLKYGFQSSYGYFDGQIDPYTHEYKMETELTSRKSWHRNDEYLEEEGHATDLITGEAIRVIEETGGKPFFLYIAYSVPHFPLNEPDQWTSHYDGIQMHPSRKWFAGSVTHMDDGIGKIVDALERTGQRDNTLLVFISDNGGQLDWESETQYRGNYADKPHRVLGNNFPLRGWKTELYEGGIRVPAFVNWPGKLQTGILDRPVHVSDWLPTLCNVSDYEGDLTSINLDGKNIWPILSGEESTSQSRDLYWKISDVSAVRSGQWKLLVFEKENRYELYDLKNDFRETRNVSEMHPEKVRELIELLEKFEEDDR